jgi:hypothetical protein
MAIKHVTTKHYKENIEIKTKKLEDSAVSDEQKKVIQQDIEKLKETHNKHVEAVVKNFDEQMKDASKEMKEKLENEKAVFMSKYAAKEAKVADVKKGETKPADGEKNECDANIVNVFGEIKSIGEYIAANTKKKQEIDNKAQKEKDSGAWFGDFNFFGNSTDSSTGTTVATYNRQEEINKISETIHTLNSKCETQKNKCELDIIQNLWNKVEGMQAISSPNNTQKK